MALTRIVAVALASQRRRQFLVRLFLLRDLVAPIWLAPDRPRARNGDLERIGVALILAFAAVHGFLSLLQ